MAEDGPEKGFLSRWSRRKRTAEAEEADKAAAASEEAATEETPDNGEIDEALAAELEENRRAAEAVDIEALTYEDDFKVFLKRGVPDVLRKKALRKLWRSNPVLANLDGLNDYDDDFGNPADNVYSSLWKVGRGFLSELEIKAQQGSGRISTAYEKAEDSVSGEPEAAEAETAEEDGPAPEASEWDADAVQVAQPEPEDETVEEPVEEPERIARVSIRRRLEG
jgi:hypothetical protein